MTDLPKTLLILDEVQLTDEQQTAFEKAWNDLRFWLGGYGGYLVECTPMPEPDHVVEAKS